MEALKLFAFTRLQEFTEPDSMGVVTDALFISCYWPKLDRPTRIFADGSSGIRVMGRTPRNVWFPDDVVFEDYVPDALYPAELAVGHNLVNLSDDEAALWLKTYDEAVAKLPQTAAVNTTQRAVNFLRHKELVSPVGAKPVYEEYVAELTAKECADLVDGKVDEAVLRTTKTFVHVSDGTVLVKTEAAPTAKKGKG